ncbi:protein kinase domain-containing protein [Streptomyces sp. CA-111067]|uniref:protein kinase domain-containing protein n=1 Tax=Streptomyces sp. CA-111067 TaxID=3240046 RepID=UPI003D99DF90
MKPLEAGDPTSLGDGRYRLTGRLGQGGMGVVYFGRSQSGRAVAAKVVRPELSTEPGFRRRFADEVAAARRVGGFHTAPVVDADPLGEPAWLVTAYVPGPTLHAVLVDVGVLPVDTLTVLAAGLAEALEAIHRAGVIHRDLKPANIIVAEDGPRVIDFGIARALDGTSLTQTGLQVGTPGFLAPEQLTGGAITAAVDMFALGVVLSQATGAAPFGDGPSAARHYRVVHEEPDLSGVPDELRDLIAGCLSKNPLHRPSPTEFLGRLTVRERPDGEWLPAEATALLPRTAPTVSGPGAAHPPTVKSGPAPAGFGPPSPEYEAAPPGDAGSGGPAGSGGSYGVAPPPEQPGGYEPTARVESAGAGQESPPYEGSPYGAGSPGSGSYESSPYGAGSYEAAPPEGAAPYRSTTPYESPSWSGPGYGPGTPPPAEPAPPRGGRRKAVGGAAAVVAVAVVAALLVWQPWSSGSSDDKHSASGGSPGTASAGSSAKAGPAGLPTAPLLVRMDTAPGWPKACHAEIALRDSGTDNPRPLVPGGTCDTLPSWSPDHSSFAFTRSLGNGDQYAWVAKADGSGAHEVTTMSGGRISWSPDGKQLAVLRKKNGIAQIFIVDIAGGSARQLTTGTRSIQDPAWSPDGTHFAVCLDTSPALPQVYLIEYAHPGAAPRQVTTGTSRATDPQWSPNGNYLAYTYGKPGVATQGDIHVVGSDGGGDYPLAATPDQEMDPVWSPDGKWVAYVRGPIETPAVWTSRVDGSGTRKLTTGTVPEGHPAWR